MSDTDSVGPPTPKQIKQSTLLAHDSYRPDFPHVLEVIDPDATKKAKRFIKQPVETALDDYFDFDDSPMVYQSGESKLKELFDHKDTNPRFDTEMYNIYQEIERRKNTPFSQVGKKAEFIRKNTPGGWNSCTRAQQLFDPNIKNKEIFGFGRYEHTGLKYKKDTDIEKYAARKAGSGSSTQFSGKGFDTKIASKGEKSFKKGVHINYEDLAEVHQVIDKANNKTLKEMAITQEAKMKNLEDMLIRERGRTDKQNIEFQSRMEDMVKDQLTHNA